jgi:phenylglyoxylate dehydrogenase gamma subunit
MYEIRTHGRGGQGAVMGAEILAKALLKEGKYAVTIPAFGFERRGAPVVAYLKFDDKVIRQHTNVRFPNIVICIDPTLPNSVPIFDGVQDNATAILCTSKGPGDFKFGPKIKKVGLCDGVSIAMATIGRSITNTIMLGAFVKVTGLVTLESINYAMEATAFRDAALEKNIIAVKKGYDQTQVYEL